MLTKSQVEIVSGPSAAFTKLTKMGLGKILGITPNPVRSAETGAIYTGVGVI